MTRQDERYTIHARKTDRFTHARAALSPKHDAESFRFWEHLRVVVHMLIWDFGEHFKTMR